MKLAAAKPARSPITPPPTAITQSPRWKSCESIARQSRSKIAKLLLCSPGSTVTRLRGLTPGTLAISFKGNWIHVDPVSGLNKPTVYSAEFPKADAILITHEHGDHLDEHAIDILSKEGTRLVMNYKSWDKIGHGDVMENGERGNLPGRVIIVAVPAYNISSGHEQFHPKGSGNGYVLSLDGFRIYIAGDTEDIPEMAQLEDIDLAFLPVNQPYTMTVEQCVRAAKSFMPKVLIPYHFSQTDISSLPTQLPDITVLLRDMQ